MTGRFSAGTAVYRTSVDQAGLVGGLRRSAGQLRSWSVAQVGILGGLVAGLTSALLGLAGRVARGFTSFLFGGGRTTQELGKIADLFRRIRELIDPAIAEAVRGVVDRVREWYDWLRQDEDTLTRLRDTIRLIGDLMEIVVGWALDLAAALVRGLGSDVVRGLLSVFIELARHIEDLVARVIPHWNTTFGEFFREIIAAFTRFPEDVRQHGWVEAVKRLIGDLWDAFVGLIGRLRPYWERFSTWLGDVIAEAVRIAFDAAIEYVSEKIKSLAERLWGLLQTGGGGNIYGPLSGPPAIPQSILGHIGGALGIGQVVVQGDLHTGDSVRSDSGNAGISHGIHSTIDLVP